MLTPTTTSGKIKIYNESGTPYTFTIDDVELYPEENVWVDEMVVKEIGTATGWTDADQELDIPQTALQSYNQLLHWHGATNNPDIAAIISDDSDLDIGTEDFTLSAWFKRDKFTDEYMSLISKGGAGGPGYSFGINSNNQLSANTSTTGNNIWSYHDSTTLVENGKWYHFVSSHDRSGNCTLYLNGETLTTSTASITAANGSLDNSSNISIGQYYPSYWQWNGCITECSIWKGVAMNNAQVKELYNDGLALDARTHSLSPDSGTDYLAGYWRNNGLAQWKDLSGNDNHSSAVNGSETMLITAGVDGSRDSQGFLMNRQRTTNSLNIRGGLSTENGEGDYINTNNKMSFAEDGFTLSFWVKYTDLSGRGITGMNDGSDHRMYIGQSNAGANEMLYGAGDGFVTGTTDQITEGKWHHVLTTYDGGSVLKCYFDGVYDKTKTDITFSGVSTDNFWIGSFEGEQYVVRGFIDDFLIYTYVKTDGGVSLTEAAKGEVGRIYNAGKRSHR